MDEKAMGLILQSLGDGAAKGTGQILGLIQAIAALVATHPNKAAFSEAFARHEVRAPIPDEAPQQLRVGYEEVVRTVELALMDNSVKGNRP